MAVHYCRLPTSIGVHCGYTQPSESVWFPQSCTHSCVVSQIIVSPIQLRVIVASYQVHETYSQNHHQHYCHSLWHVWNLDFFRMLIPGICLHLDTLQVLALDYLIAVYPMLLMVVAYVLVELHNSGFKPILILWKPFHNLSAQFRKEWNIQTSLMDAFVTFFILSTTKLFSVSFELLMPYHSACSQWGHLRTSSIL